MLVYINVLENKVSVEGVMLDVDLTEMQIDKSIKEITWIDSIGYENRTNKSYAVAVFDFSSYAAVLAAWTQAASQYTEAQLDQMRSAVTVEEMRTRKDKMIEFFNSEEYREMVDELN